MTLGQRLYEMRKGKGLSQENVAEILGVTRQTISKWETDQTTPDFDKIVPLCKLYNITTDELLIGETNSTECYENSRYEITQNDSMQPDNNEQIEKGRIKSAFLMAVSICLYILSVIPFFVLENGKMMISCFFIIIAVATMLVVFSQLSKPKALKKTERQTMESTLYKRITGILSGVILVIYMLVSFLTHAWHITWILWVIYGIICEIIKLILILKGADDNDIEE